MTRLWFLNDIIFKFVFADENNKPTLRALLVDVAHEHSLDDVLELHLVELPKFDVEKPINLRTPF